MKPGNIVKAKDIDQLYVLLEIDPSDDLSHIILPLNYKRYEEICKIAFFVSPHELKLHTEPTSGQEKDAARLLSLYIKQGGTPWTWPSIANISMGRVSYPSSWQRFHEVTNSLCTETHLADLISRSGDLVLEKQITAPVYIFPDNKSTSDAKTVATVSFFRLCNKIVLIAKIYTILEEWAEDMINNFLPWACTWIGPEHDEEGARLFVELESLCKKDLLLYLSKWGLPIEDR